MAFDRTPLGPEQAAAILEKWLGRAVEPPSIERLSGGMINSVLLLRFEAEPGAAVIKISSETGTGQFEHEARVLHWLRENTEFPVPDVYLHEADGATAPLSFLLLEWLPGANLGQASLTSADRADIDRQMAYVLLDLHAHQREEYGGIFDGEGHDRWVDVFQPRVQSMYEAVDGRIAARAYSQIERILAHFDRLFDHQGEPTLVHGDIWATNVMVAPQNATWQLVGFVDPGAQFADVEYELAYLEVFNTVTPEFFRHYARISPLREGYERRRLLYWLNTMLIHVKVFGDAHYVRNTEQLAEAICEQWLG